MYISVRSKLISLLLTAILLLSAGGLSAMDTRDFGRGFNSYYQGNYEETTLPDGTTKKLHYLPGCSVMVETVSPGCTTGTKVLYYGYQDHLGSLTALVRERINGNGSIGRIVADYRSYDAWGRLRKNDDWTQSRTNALQITDRGYTGHEHLTDFGIINMNGRVYDPLTAQFFSPDPYVQASDNRLNYNRYAYCLDNPLIYTDPDGELFVLDDIIVAGLFGIFVNHFYQMIAGNINSVGDFYLSALVGFIGGAAGAMAGQLVAGTIGLGGFIGGAAIGGAEGATNTDDIGLNKLFADGSAPVGYKSSNGLIINEKTGKEIYGCTEYLGKGKSNVYLSKRSFINENQLYLYGARVFACFL